MRKKITEVYDKRRKSKK